MKISHLEEGQGIKKNKKEKEERGKMIRKLGCGDRAERLRDLVLTKPRPEGVAH